VKGLLSLRFFTSFRSTQSGNECLSLWGIRWHLKEFCSAKEQIQQFFPGKSLFASNLITFWLFFALFFYRIEIPETFEDEEVLEKTQLHLDNYAKQGLRVLVMAKRSLSEDEYQEWAAKHKEAEV